MLGLNGSLVIGHGHGHGTVMISDLAGSLTLVGCPWTGPDDDGGGGAGWLHHGGDGGAATSGHGVHVHLPDVLLC